MCVSQQVVCLYSVCVSLISLYVSRQVVCLSWVCVSPASFCVFRQFVGLDYFDWCRIKTLRAEERVWGKFMTWNSWDKTKFTTWNSGDGRGDSEIYHCIIFFCPGWVSSEILFYPSWLSLLFLPRPNLFIWTLSEIIHFGDRKSVISIPGIALIYIYMEASSQEVVLKRLHSKVVRNLIRIN